MDMSEILKKAQELQEKMKNAETELTSIKVEGVSGGGMVKVVANGKQEIINIEIEPEVINIKEKEFLEEMIAAAVNEAIKQAKEAASKTMQDKAGNMFGNALGDFKIPGL